MSLLPVVVIPRTPRSPGYSEDAAFPWCILRRQRQESLCRESLCVPRGDQPVKDVPLGGTSWKRSFTSFRMTKG